MTTERRFVSRHVCNIFLKSSPACLVADDLYRCSIIACQENGPIMKRAIASKTLQDLQSTETPIQTLQSCEVGTTSMGLTVHSNSYPWSGYCFSNQHFQRLPAISSLNSSEQRWVHTEQSFSEVWEFSALEHLALRCRCFHLMRSQKGSHHPSYGGWSCLYFDLVTI
jgi:hypothetical protein